MVSVIPVSFKKNKVEQDMFNYVKGKSSPSIYIKELIEKDMNEVEIDSSNNKQKEIGDKQKTQPSSVNLSALKNMGR